MIFHRKRIGTCSTKELKSYRSEKKKKQQKLRLLFIFLTFKLSIVIFLLHISFRLTAMNSGSKWFCITMTYHTLCETKKKNYEKMRMRKERLQQQQNLCKYMFFFCWNFFFLLQRIDLLLILTAFPFCKKNECYEKSKSSLVVILMD